MLCVTDAYLRDISNTIFVILHLELSRLNVCCSCEFLFWFTLPAGQNVFWKG